MTVGLRFADSLGAAYEAYLARELAAEPPASAAAGPPSKEGSLPPLVGLPPPPPRRAAPLALGSSELTIDLLPVGLEGYFTVFVAPDDLALPPDVYTCSISAPRVVPVPAVISRSSIAESSPR